MKHLAGLAVLISNNITRWYRNRRGSAIFTLIFANNPSILKILIITAWYAPFIHPRAHRWSTLAEHWAAAGHEVQVVTARLRGCPDEAVLQGVQVHRVGFDSLKEVAYYYFSSHRARGRVGVLPQRQGFFARLVARVYTLFWKKIFFPDDACLWYFPARRKINALLEQQKPDLLISVSLPFTGHLLGMNAKKRYPNLHWLADIGDPFSFRLPPPNNTFLYAARNARLERQVLETADTVSVTTLATLQKYREVFGDRAVQKMKVIPPLFHQQINISPSPKHDPAMQLRIGYFGALYAPTRTPDGFLDVWTQLQKQHAGWHKRSEVHFYGEIFPEFYEKMSRLPGIQLHGLCSRDEVWHAMQQMDILLHIGNITDFQLPSKAVDYLASGKPIIHLSYTENDPFMAFFGQNDLVFDLKVEDNRVKEDAVLRLLQWLETPKHLPGKEELERVVAPFRTEAVGYLYIGN